MKNTVFLADIGIVPNTEKDCTKELQNFFDSLPDNTCVHFKKGSYYISGTIEIEGKKDIKILGNCSTVIAHFDPTAPVEEDNNVFHITNCSVLSIEGFFFDTDNSIGATGEVVAIDNENYSCDLVFSDEFKWTGFEHIVGTNSFDEKGKRVKGICVKGKYVKVIS